MFDQERQLANDLALMAGKRVLEMYEEGAEVSYKDKKEPVTEADLAANRIIIEGIRQAFPDDGILSEESRDDLSRLDKERVWIVDPLDGTQEFVDRVGQFAVMIALAVNGEPMVGAVYQPVGDRLWSAAEGFGAVLIEGEEARRLAVSTRSQNDGMRLVVTRSHGFDGIEEIKAGLGITDHRKLGSVGLKVGAIVTDEADLYIHISRYTKEWDSCAPDAILRQAGGTMTDLLGRPLHYNKREVLNVNGLLASNGVSHDEAVKVVHPWVVKAGLDKP